jgi:microcystin-dependent protein
MPQHNHTSSSSISNTVDTSSSEATLRAIASGASTNIPTNTILANSPGRENIYSSCTPNVDMSSSAIELNIVAAVTSDVTTTIGQTGGKQALGIRSPYLAVTWLVALNGTYPSRN